MLSEPPVARPRPRPSCGGNEECGEEEMEDRLENGDRWRGWDRDRGDNMEDCHGDIPVILTLRLVEVRSWLMGSGK